MIHANPNLLGQPQAILAVGSGVLLGEQIARRAHANQFRRDGVTPYIEHPAAVAAWLSGNDDDTIATAWLHDVIEDTAENGVTLRAAGVSENVIRAVMALTKHPGQEYDEYIKNVKKNPMARKVKIADMINNLCDMPTSAQIKKYNRGLKALLA